MPNNLSTVNNQTQDPRAAIAEKVINSIDALLVKKCLLNNILPESSQAPQTMSEASEIFFNVPDGNLANLTSDEVTNLAENIQLVATGTRTNPSYLIIDKGEGQIPAQFKNTFLRLTHNNKAGIKFVHGRFNAGGTGVLPFLGRNGSEGYQLIISRRCPNIPSGPLDLESRDDTHDLWGFTLVRLLPVSAGIYNTPVYMYLAPEGEILSFEAETIDALPTIPSGTIGQETDSEEEEEDVGVEKSKSARRVPRPCREGLEYGTVIKLYDFNWKNRGLATIEVRRALNHHLHHIVLPIRIVETRDYEAHYYATSESGIATTIEKDHQKGFVEGIWHGVVNPPNLGEFPITTILYHEYKKTSKGEEKTTKDPKWLPMGLHYTYNGQSHKSFTKGFFSTRGLNYDYIRDNLIVYVDCKNIPDTIKHKLIMPSKDRFRDIAEFDVIEKSIVDYLKTLQPLRTINDNRRVRRAKDKESPEKATKVWQGIVDKDPVFAAKLRGRGLRTTKVGPPKPTKVHKGVQPPTKFNFKNNSNFIEKSFAIDRTCRVVLETDAVNGYFDLPDPKDKGRLNIEPNCFQSHNLIDGELGIVFRAPSDSRIDDKLEVTITITDPIREAGGKQPFINKVVFTFTEGGKVTSSGTKGKRPPKTSEVGVPDPEEIRKDRWEEFNPPFNEDTAVRVMSGKADDDHMFYVNMDNKILHNYKILAKDDFEREVLSQIFKWGLVVVCLGLLHYFGEQDSKDNGPYQDAQGDPKSPRDLVSELSEGLASTIIPTGVVLKDVMEEVT